jgi:hypothetical protein
MSVEPLKMKVMETKMNKPKAEPVDLTDWRIKTTVKEMREMLKDKGVAGLSKMKKEGLITEIEKLGLMGGKKKESPREARLRELEKGAKDVESTLHYIAYMNGSPDPDEDFEGFTEFINDNLGEYADAVVEHLKEKKKTMKWIANDATTMDEGFTMFDDLIREHADAEKAKAWFKSKGQEPEDDDDMREDLLEMMDGTGNKLLSEKKFAYQDYEDGAGIEVIYPTSAINDMLRLARAGKSVQAISDEVGYIFREVGQILFDFFTNTSANISKGKFNDNEGLKKALKMRAKEAKD